MEGSNLRVNSHFNEFHVSIVTREHYHIFIVFKSFDHLNFKVLIFFSIKNFAKDFDSSNFIVLTFGFFNFSILTLFIFV